MIIPQKKRFPLIKKKISTNNLLLYFKELGKEHTISKGYRKKEIQKTKHKQNGKATENPCN